MHRLLIACLAVLTATTAHATVMSGTHQSAAPYAQLAQFYVPGPRYQPRYSRPYEYDRPYRGPGREGDVYHPAERDWNNAMRRFRYEREWRDQRYLRPY